MHLDVPLFRQEKDSKDCGIICVQMILAFYKQERSFQEIKNSIEVHEEGTYVPQLGSYLLKNGFDVEIITLHPGLFTIQDIEAPQEMIRKRIEDLQTKATAEWDKKTLHYFHDYLSLGGVFTPNIPNKKEVQKSIDKQEPLIVLLTSHFLTESQPTVNFHFNVITGYTDAKILRNDPLDDHRGGKHATPTDFFFYGMYASLYGGLDNGSLMKIKKK